MVPVLLLTVLAQATPPARTYDVDLAVRLTLEHHPGLRGVRARTAAAEDQSRSLRGRFLPTIVVSDEHQRYSEEYRIPFPGLGPLTARQLNVNTLVAAASQPVLGLLHLSQEKAALDDLAAAARVGEQSAEAAILESVRTGYLRYFEARAAEEVARAAIAQLEEQRQVTEARVKAGAATTADVLRVEVAAANARQQAIQAQAQQQVVRSALLLAMGFSAQDAEVVLAEPTALEEADPPALTEVEAQAAAATRRPEVERARLEHSAASHQATGRLLALLPEANLEAAFVRIQGQEPFAPPQSAYVGVKASWVVWDWGATWYAHRAAVRLADAAGAAREDQQHQVMGEASARLAAATSSRAAVEVAQAAIASAEEAWRVTQALAQAGTATTTDLLDAQGALTQARLNLVRAKYQRAVAAVGLQRAVGSAGAP
jgi:outer membrane protein TolC